MTGPISPNALRLNPIDDVIIAMRRVETGETFAGEDVLAKEPIPRGHKAAIRALKSGQVVRKYGQVIGSASADIAAGAVVHSHNLCLSALRGQAAAPPPF